MTKPRMVALDIDGTLIPAGASRPPTDVVDAVRSLMRAGIGVVLASGRMFPGVERVARELGVNAPVICQQGCSIHLPGGEIDHIVPLDPRLARDLVGFAREREHPYEWFNPLRYLVSSWTAQSEDYATYSGVQAEYHPAPELLGIEPTGVGIISDHRRAADVHRTLVSLHADLLHVLDFPDVTVCVAPEANKGFALAMICRDLGIERSEVVAIGDSVNDAAMLEWAGTGVAMPESDRYALAAADLRLDPSATALSQFLRTLGP